jgi:hypothetical protein
VAKEPEVVPLPRKPPRPGALAKRISALVADGAFSFASGAFNRTDGPEIDLGDAMEVLTAGSIEGEITPGESAGEWRCRMVRKIDKSARRLAVVSIVIRDVHVFMISVAWEPSR